MAVFGCRGSPEARTPHPSSRMLSCERGLLRSTLSTTDRPRASTPRLPFPMAAPARTRRRPVMPFSILQTCCVRGCYVHTSSILQPGAAPARKMASEGVHGCAPEGGLHGRLADHSSGIASLVHLAAPAGADRLCNPDGRGGCAASVRSHGDSDPGAGCSAV